MIGPYPAWTHDAETYKPFTLYGFRDMLTSKVRQFSNRSGHGESFAALREWFPQLQGQAILVGFNSIGFDNHILNAILAGEDDPLVLYDLGQDLIKANQGWTRVKRVQALDEISIDLMAIAGKTKGEPNLGSLKELGIKLGFWRLQELPIPHTQEVLSPDEMAAICAYNGYDLEITASAARMMAGAILARFAMQDEFNVPVLNDGDAKMAERVMQRQLFGDAKPIYSNQSSWLITGDQLVQGFQYQHPELQALCDRLGSVQLRSHVETITDATGRAEKKMHNSPLDDEVKVGETTYTLGRGGLHSKDRPGMVVADARYVIKCADVSGAYPAVIASHRIVPAHLPANKFQAAFGDLRQRRVVAKAKAKRTGDVIDRASDVGLKNNTNSLFGKCGSPYSWLCDPPALMKCTLKGQLSLLLLIDLVAQYDDCTVLSANTDGLFLRLPVAVADEVVARLTGLAAGMQLTLDWNDYAMVARRDVNAYFAIDTAGKITGKGAYGYDPTTLKGKPINLVAIDAMQQFFQHGTPIEQTVRGCRDILKFINYQKVPKAHTIIGSDGRVWGKIARWYLGVQGCHLDKVRDADGKPYQLVESGAVVINDLPDAFPVDIDYAAYSAMAERLVKDVLEPAVRESDAIPLAELGMAQRAQHTVNLADLDSTPERQQLIDVARAQDDYAKSIKGNPHSSMLHVLVRAWYAGRGRLTLGDLLWLGREIDLDGAWGPAGRHDLAAMAGSIARKCSPFPLPRTTAEQVARALTWARETVAPCKRQNKHLRHISVFRSSFLNSDALRKFAKTGNEYALACAICAVCVKHTPGGVEIDPNLVLNIISEVKTYFTQDALHAEIIQRKSDGLPGPLRGDPEAAATVARGTLRDDP